MRFTGSSHDEHGMLTKDPAKVGRLNEHLWRKIEDHRDEIEMVQADLQPGARTLLVSYGITARAMLEAVQDLRRQGACVSAWTVQSLWPVPERALLAAIVGADGRAGLERIVVAELNLGEYRLEVERVVYGWAARTRTVAPEIVGIHRVDGELITPGSSSSRPSSNRIQPKRAEVEHEQYDGSRCPPHLSQRALLSLLPRLRAWADPRCAQPRAGGLAARSAQDGHRDATSAARGWATSTSSPTPFTGCTGAALPTPPASSWRIPISTSSS